MVRGIGRRRGDHLSRVWPSKQFHGDEGAAIALFDSVNRCKCRDDWARGGEVAAAFFTKEAFESLGIAVRVLLEENFESDCGVQVCRFGS